MLAQVVANLRHVCLWTGLESRGSVVLGVRPGSTHREWVAVHSMEKPILVALIGSWFLEIEQHDARPKQVTAAFVNADGTVVYYTIHDGIAKPRQN